MTARIYTGRLFHARIEPLRHVFTYPAFMLGIDLADLDRIAARNPFLGHNRPRLCTIRDKDYLGSGVGGIEEKLRRHLDGAGLRIDAFQSVLLLTTPRVFGLGFNPLNLFFCRDPAGEIQAVVAEVHNTYGEARIYVLGDAERVPDGAVPARFRFPKTLFVSPFNGVEGHYDLSIGGLGDRIEIRLGLQVRDRLVIQTGLSLRGRDLTTGALARTVLRQPLTAALAFPRIAKQALILRYRKGLTPRLKPKAIGNGPKTGSATLGRRQT